jgi:hypothetical protein
MNIRFDAAKIVVERIEQRPFVIVIIVGVSAGEWLRFRGQQSEQKKCENEFYWRKGHGDAVK